MTRCLNEDELQAVADHEADAAARAHVNECAACRARVEDARRDLAALAAQTNRVAGPSIEFEQRLRHMLNASRVAPAAGTGAGDVGIGVGAGVAAGATTMRRVETRVPLWRQRTWTSGLAAAALVILAVFVVYPSVTKQSRLSAAEILSRSLQKFSATTGVETSAYDVKLEGLATRSFVPDGGVDSLRVEQVVDHDHPGRYRITKVDAHQVLRMVLAQDPERGTRVGRFRVDDKMYFFKFTAAPDRAGAFVSLPDLQRAYIRALVTMMQGTADEKLTTIDDGGGGGSYYAIQMPHVSMQSAPTAATEAAGRGATEAGDAMLDLAEAHALVHAGDFHLKELSARGTFLGQPFGVAFTLVRHEATPSHQIDASMFTVEPEPGDIMLEGEATSDPAADVVLAALRTLGEGRP
jgi:hypothetical protein